MARYVLLLLGALLIWLHHSWGGPSERAEDFDRLRADGVRTPGVVTEIDEREVTQRRRRSTTTRTEYCPVVRYVERLDGQRVARTFTEYDACQGWEVGDEVTVLTDPEDPGVRHIDSDAVRDSLAGAERTHTWSAWLGYGLVVAAGLTIVLGWRGRLRRRRARRTA